jgi:hypothetical protein
MGEGWKRERLDECGSCGDFLRLQEVEEASADTFEASADAYKAS